MFVYFFLNLAILQKCVRVAPKACKVWVAQPTLFPDNIDFVTTFFHMEKLYKNKDKRILQVVSNLQKLKFPLFNDLNAQFMDIFFNTAYSNIISSPQ